MPSVSAQYAIILRVEIDHRPGMLGRVATAIGEAGGSIGSVDLIGIEGGHTLRDITIETAGEDHAQQIGDAVDTVDGARAVDITDRTFQMHVGGKIETAHQVPDPHPRRPQPRLHARRRARLHRDPQGPRPRLPVHDQAQHGRRRLRRLSAVLGLGDIGPEAAMPVMEGKAVLFKEFGGVDAFPICLSTKDPDKIVEIVTAISPSFGGINLEDISAPRCFEIEDRLKATLDIPVFHDDQHGTAVVTLAALINAAKLTGKELKDLKVLVVGLGAAGIAVAKILQSAGVSDIIGCDRKGAVATDPPRLRGRQHDAGQALVRRPHQRREAPGQARGRDRRRRRLHRPLRPQRDARRAR